MEDNLALVHHLFGRSRWRSWRWLADDLIRAGYEGLCKAAQRYDEGHVSERTGGEGHQAANSKGRKKSPKLDACVAWLEGVLKGGPMKVYDIRRLNDAADGPNFGQTLLYAARDVMKLRDYREANRPWWALPGTDEEG